MNRSRHLLRTLAAAVVALGVLVVAGAVPALATQAAGGDSVGFGVTPLRHAVDVSAGQSVTKQLTITNTDTSATKFTFTKEDYAGDQDDPGATPVLLGGRFESKISGYDWIAVPDPVTIGPGDSKTINVRIDVPAGATGGHYTAVMVNGEARSAGRIVASSRIGVLFMLNAGGVPPPEIVITEIQEVGPDRTVTKFINRGSTETKHTRGTLTRDPVGPGKGTKTRGECTQVVLPGAAGTCVFETPDGGGDGALLGAGPVKPSVSIVGDPGEEGTAARGELPTEWAGTWTGLLLPLVGVALFVLYFLFLRRRRREDEEDDAVIAWAGDGDELS
jgi:hypothetical protein